LSIEKKSPPLPFSCKSFSAEEIQSTLEYWTPERIKKAQSESLAEMGRESLNIMSSNSSHENLLGEPFPVDVNKYPYSAGGQLLYEKSDGGLGVASAQFVGHCRILLTVAHSIRDGDTGEFNKNFLFYRGHGGTEQLFSIERVCTFDAWVGRDYKFDYAYCYTSVPWESNGLLLEIGINHTELQSIGYPLDYENGSVMYAVNGTRGRIVSGVVDMEGNPMRNGASGGAWIANVNSNGHGTYDNLVVGVNSQFVLNEPIYTSSLFDRNTVELFYQTLNPDPEQPPRQPPGDECEVRISER
jgi:hypothetical protein